MKISKSKNDTFTIKCNRDELDVLRNALNNIPQAVDECEYTALIGATKEKTDIILDALVDALASQ